MTPQSSHPRIEICGGIASGKTTLAVLLSKVGLQIELENFSSNPFFSDFYSDPSGYAFETEITFLLQHFSAIRAKPWKGGIKAFDFSLALDLAYSHVTLSTEDQAVFGVVLRASVKKVGIPDLLVRLRCDVDEELARIRKRGREQEQKIDRNYLHEIESALDRVIISEPFADTNVLEIDSQVTNYVSDPAGISKVCQEIKSYLADLGNEFRFKTERDPDIN